jgi:FSR family fosmidomycin resistance protein-like MFS transporter
MRAETAANPANRPKTVHATLYTVLFSISIVHLLNDSIQSVIPAIFPILKESMSLSYVQIGLIAFALNVTASIMQPLIGTMTDARPMPYLLPIGMSSTFLGITGLAFAANFYMVLISVVMIGIGSAVFHPEGSRVAYLSAGGRRGLAQSIFQVGGNAGQSIAPVLTALIFVPLGQFGAIYFTALAAMAILIQLFIARWYQNTLRLNPPVKKKRSAGKVNLQQRHQVVFVLSVLVIIMFSKSWFTAGVTNYYPFYLIEHFGLTIERAQIFIFVYLLAGAIGTFLGGPLADWIGRRNVIWISILGSIPFAALLPYANLAWAYVLLALLGLVLMSSFSVIVVYAQELLPGKVGMVSGLFFGLSFGLGGLGSVALGSLADLTSIQLVIQMSGLLPLLGILTLFLPSDAKIRAWSEA